jgi:two-component system phosphate regulon response regulator PhoB
VGEDGGKVLIVDDESEIAVALGHLIQRAGLTTIFASDGDSSLRSIKTENPDLLIVD